MPVATAITFLSAPPSSTPTTSSLVYTRNAAALMAPCTSFAASSEELAATTAVGCPCATSAAKLGPLTATTSCPSASCATTSVIKANVSRSIPLVATDNTALGVIEPAHEATTARNTCEGAAYTTRPAPCSALAMSLLAVRPGASVMFGRNRGFSCRALTASTTSSSRAQSVTRWPFRTRRSAIAVPQAPPPITAHTSARSVTLDLQW